MSAVNKSPWSYNIYGAERPMIIPGLVQAGSTQAIKRGEICVYNETSTYWVPANAVADAKYSLAIANEEQKADGSARYMEFIALREGDVFEFVLAAAGSLAVGSALTLTASDSQKLTYDADGQAVAFYVGRANYPESGTSVQSITYAQVCFNPEYSYLYKNVLQRGLKKVIAATAAYTLLLEDNGAIVTNKGAIGSVTITAPNAVVPIGWHIYLAAMAAQVLVFDPKPDTASVIVKGAIQAAGKYISVTDEGDFVHLVWDGTDWLAFASVSGADADITVES